MLWELGIIGLTGALLSLRFRLFEIFLVSVALLIAWIFISATGASSIVQATGHFFIDLIALQGGAFSVLMIKNRYRFR